jgi:hypothetical protein
VALDLQDQLSDRYRGDLSAHDRRPQCRHRVGARPCPAQLPGHDKRARRSLSRPRDLPGAGAARRGGRNGWRGSAPAPAQRSPRRRPALPPRVVRRSATRPGLMCSRSERRPAEERCHWPYTMISPNCRKRHGTGTADRQGQADNEKSLWIPSFPRYRTRSVSRSGKTTGAKRCPQILLTNPFPKAPVFFNEPSSFSRSASVVATHASLRYICQVPCGRADANRNCSRSHLGDGVHDAHSAGFLGYCCTTAGCLARICCLGLHVILPSTCAEIETHQLILRCSHLI